MADNRSVIPPPRTPALIAFLVCIWLVDSAGVALGQRWRQEPGRWEFTGKMVVRPLQVEHWMERGFTREEAQVRYQRAVEYTIDTLGEHVYRYHERMDEYWFFVPPGRSENDIGEQLIETGYYRYVCPNWWAAPTGFDTSEATLDDCTNDPNLSNQWHHTRIESCAGWQIHTAGHDDVVIGFVDMGLAIGHEDVSNLNQYRRTGYNAEHQCWESTTCSIEEGSPWHGTKALGAGAATGNNEAGVSGIGWSLRHRMLNGVGQLDTFFDSLWVSATAGDRVICSTAGFPLIDSGVWKQFFDHTEAMILSDQFDPVPIVFQAAGNRLAYEYGPLPYMVIVGGTQQNDARWVKDETWRSPVGDFIDVMAPAKDIYSTAGNSQYSATSGTSYATPQVAGLAALIWSYDPDLDREDVLDVLYRGCDPIVDYNQNLHGAGRINVFNSLALASGSVWTRTPYPGEAGTTNYFKAAGAGEGTTVWFFYGDGSGQTQVTVGNCSITLDIANATLVPAESAVATANGAAIIAQAVPGSWAQETVWLQCVEEAGCRKSNVVVFEFE